MSLRSFWVSVAALIWVQSAYAHELGAEQPVLIQLEYENSSEGDGATSSQSSGRQALVETVIERRPDAKIIEYSVPEGGKTNFWYFPVRILEQNDGTVSLHNRSDLEERIQEWLDRYGIPRELCGKWTHGGGFPFKYDCDPESALEQIASHRLGGPEIKEGAQFTHPQGTGEAVLEYADMTEKQLIAEFAVDQVAARKSDAEQRLILAQMMGDTLTEAQAAVAAEQIGYHGSITVLFDLDASGKVWRRTDTTRVVVSSPETGSEVRKAKVTVTRTQPGHTS